MFTGIVEEIGVVERMDRKADLYSLSLRASNIASGTHLGDSVAIDGVCLTVTRIERSRLYFDIMKETIEKTNLKNLVAGDKVNLERALKAGGRFGGHIVTGHVDAAVVITGMIQSKNYIEFRIGIPARLKKFIVSKGSVCLNGVSLTIGEISRGQFSVYLIPFTMNMTTMSGKKIGDLLNLEADILARYILNSRKA